MPLYYLKGVFRYGIVFKKEIEAAAGRPSGRRPIIITGGMGASAPIIAIEDFFNNDSERIFSLKKAYSPLFPTPPGPTVIPAFLMR
jgi:hypothetical protein